VLDELLEELLFPPPCPPQAESSRPRLAKPRIFKQLRDDVFSEKFRNIAYPVNEFTKEASVHRQLNPQKPRNFTAIPLSISPTRSHAATEITKTDQRTASYRIHFKSEMPTLPFDMFSYSLILDVYAALNDGAV
jgi:hypothetical protein